MTIEAWVLWRDFGDFGHFVSFGQPGRALVLTNGLSTNKLEAHFYDPSSVNHKIIIPKLLRPDVWNHVALVLGSQAMTLYWNGYPIGRNHYTGSFKECAAEGTQYLGRSLWSGDDRFYGCLDEVRIWSIARTGEEIRSTMSGPLAGGDDQGLELYYSFDEGGGQTAIDQSGKGRHGRLGETGEMDGTDPLWVAMAFPEPLPDRDSDLLPDLVEGGVLPESGKTHPYLSDSDGDGLSDSTEDLDHNGFYDPERDWENENPPETSGRNRDSDGDGFEDGIEVLLLESDATVETDPGVELVDQDTDALPGDLDPDDEAMDFDGDRFSDGYEAAVAGLDAASEPGVVPLIGDVDENGVHDNADSQLVLNLFNGLWNPETHSSNTDLNRDARIDNADAQHALNFFGVHGTLLLPADDE